jgi:hypothetical protein
MIKNKVVSFGVPVLFFVAMFLSPFFIVSRAEAAVSDWQRGVTLFPRSSIDFSSVDFRTSVTNAKTKTGATYITLVIPHYQSDAGASDLQSGYNTPTDASIVDAITYIHGQGLKVMLKFHTYYYGDNSGWAGVIDARDRPTWFANYGAILTRYAQLAQANNVEILCIGNEIAHMTGENIYADNTTYWVSMIQSVRNVYAGKLTYSANRSNDPFSSNYEIANIQFWGSLDYLGMSPYYTLGWDLQASWANWKSVSVDPFLAKWNKPLIFTETGYRSISGARYSPWSWAPGGQPDQAEQANDYEAFLSFWNSDSRIAGASFWGWSVDPNAGGAYDTDYTPQNKTAEGVLKKWFSGTATSTPPSVVPPAQYTFSFRGQSAPTSPTENTSAVLTVNVTNTKSFAVPSVLVDVELYDAFQKKINQQFFGQQSFASGETRVYTIATSLPAGRYYVKAGVFSDSWTTNYSWSDLVYGFDVVAASATTPATGLVTIETWWPLQGSSISGVQPFKALLQNKALVDYVMYWQVDGDVLNVMQDNNTGAPHKEALVDVSLWKWHADNRYLITFVAKDLAGATIAQKSITVTVMP